MSRPGRDTHSYRIIRARIQRETTNCWRCGKAISNEYRWPHPLSVTVGHLIALQDCIAQGIDPEDESLLAGECIACNMRDGARRSNRNQGPSRTGRRTTPRHSTLTVRASYTDPDW
jgi:hypothetical protein